MACGRNRPRPRMRRSYTLSVSRQSPAFFDAHHTSLAFSFLRANHPFRGSINLELAKPYAGCQPCFNLRLLHCLTLLLDRVLNVCHVSLEIGMRFANAMVRNAAVCDQGHLGGGGGGEGRLGRGRVVINERALTVCRKRENTD